jgi:uncharacterized membrane protein
MVPLGRLDPGDSAASDVSADGTVIVGSSNAVAVIWDEANGMRDLKGVLVNDFGLDLSGWSLHEALGVSDDGRTIVGMGRNPQGKSEGWIAVIPEPSTALLLASGLLALATFHRRQSGCGITAANATGTIV